MTRIEHRLQPFDDFNVRQDTVFGLASTVVLGFRFEKPVSQNSLLLLRRRLNAGPLNRTVKKAKILGARDRWVTPQENIDFLTDHESLAESELHQWIEDITQLPLDIVHGPTARLASVNLKEGGTVVLFHFHHALADALGGIGAWTSALQGTTYEPPPQDNLWEDLKDSGRELKKITSQLPTMLRSLRNSRDRLGRETVHSEDKFLITAAELPRVSNAESFSPLLSFFEFDKTAFQEAAAQRGGSVTSLCAAISARMLAATGLVPEDSTIRILQQVSNGPQGQVNGNFSFGVNIEIDFNHSLYEDLSPIRSKSKAAFQDHSADPGLIDAFSLFQMLPDYAFRKLESVLESQESCLASTTNLGQLDELSLTIDNQVAQAAYITPIFQGLKEARRWRKKFPATIALGYLVKDRAILTIGGISPDLNISREKFVALAVEESARWGLTPLRTV